MQLYPNNAQIQLRGLFCFASTPVPYDNEVGLLTDEALDVYHHVMRIVSGTYREFSPHMKIYALNVMYNILSTHAGRLEYFNTRSVTVEGEQRQDAIERHQMLMIKQVLKYLENIPGEYSHTCNKGSSQLTVTLGPSRIGVDLVEGALLCLSVLAMEQDTREILGEVCIDTVISALNVSK
jgi:hypothetical protein